MTDTKREVAQKLIIKYIDALLPGSENANLYSAHFAAMSDKEFDTFMMGLNDGSVKLTLTVPNLSKDKLSVDRNFKIAEELKHNFFEHIWMRDTDGVAYLTPIPYLIIDLPLRRQAQLLVKKISIPEDNKSVDDLTGQPTGKSKGSKISYPETQILAALDLEDTLHELLKVRGGDDKSFIASNDSISKTGGFSLKAIEQFSGGVKSTEVLHNLLTSAHLSNTLTA